MPRYSLSFLMTLLLLASAPAFARQAKATAPSSQPMAPYVLAISVADLEQTVAWYHDNLGFQLTEQMDLPKYQVKIAFMEYNEFRLEIVEHHKSFSQATIQERMPEIKEWDHVQGLMKFGFLVDHVAPMADRLRKNGVKFQTGIMKAEGSWGDSFIVLDNNGNWIQFAEKPRPR